VPANNDLLYAENLAKLSNINSFSLPFVAVDYVETKLKLLDTTRQQELIIQMPTT